MTPRRMAFPNVPMMCFIVLPSFFSAITQFYTYLSSIP